MSCLGGPFRIIRYLGNKDLVFSCCGFHVGLEVPFKIASAIGLALTWGYLLLKDVPLLFLGFQLRVGKLFAVMGRESAEVILYV